MQKVITINLSGHAYQVEENGYAALVAYLEGANRQLADNPDRAEIVADLEQAIAEKCGRFLGAHKSVVSASSSARSRICGTQSGAVKSTAWLPSPS